ncbi:hypothetical protein Cni_G21727 [Canna indica]|uniref:Pentatricopeptide repeat-containing protein n=1 Tax=Canna indica TaxID=4628 RepID=A0AAQ3QKK5_9LILI|nr:hypothetical protein Cni_G21727 [Canna indica]
MQSQIPRSNFTSSLFHRRSRTKTPSAAAKTLHAHLLRIHLLPHAAVDPKVLLLRPHPCDVSRWNSLLSALARHGFCSPTLRTFAIVNSLGLPPDSYSFCTVLTVSFSSKAADLGRQIHARAFRSGWISSIFVSGALIDCYARSLATGDASQLFDEMAVRNTVCVNSLLSGYVESQRWEEGLFLFRRMPELELDPDGFTLSAILRICADAPAVSLGLQVHAYLCRRSGLVSEDAFLTSSLLDMYGKCGLVGKARFVFELAGQEAMRDIVLWTSMLNAYGRNGQFAEVVETYENMLSLEIEPDEIALLAVLSACNHSGDVIKGLYYFESMWRVHKMVPGPEHYGCVVDMLCRVGNLPMAWKFANEMMLEKDYNGCSNLGVSVWGALLSACRDSGNIEIGQFAAKMALELDPNNAGIYAELSNLYASVGLWDKIGELREVMKVKGLRKDVGCSRLNA